MVKTNGLVQGFASSHPFVSVVDVFTPMLKDGKPRPELFGPDNLHMNPDGYKLWTSIIKPLLAD
jgi:lysophospholipase L1-like esterase